MEISSQALVIVQGTIAVIVMIVVMGIFGPTIFGMLRTPIEGRRRNQNDMHLSRRWKLKHETLAQNNQTERLVLDLKARVTEAAFDIKARQSSLDQLQRDREDAIAEIGLQHEAWKRRQSPIKNSLDLD